LEDSDNIIFSDIIIFEIDKLTKEYVKILNNIIKKCSSKEVFIFCEDVENKFLLKYALHFSLNKLHLLSESDENIEKLLKSISKNIDIKNSEKLQIEISKKINSFFALMLFHNDKLVFVNDKTKKLFDCNDLSSIDNIIKNSEKISDLLNQEENGKIDFVMKNSSGEDWNYEFFLDIFENGVDKLITIVTQNKVEKNESFLTTINRFMFIEKLKDRLVQNDINNIPTSIVCINISNYNKLLSVSGSIAVHDFVKKFIEKLCFYKNTCQDLSQWTPSFFVFLVEAESFKHTKEELDSMHQKLIYSELDDKISPIITSSALCINKLEINDIISSIDQISQHEFKAKDFNSSDYFEINHFSDYLEENEQIEHYLQSCIPNKTPIKLLNIYKGLCINTASRVIQIKENSYFLHCENLQAYSMKFDNKTVIQSADLPKDIEADIKYVNIEKKYAILENLHYLEFSANNRQHTRVQLSIRTPITFKYLRYSYQGEILDISTQAIAMKFNHSLSDEIVSKEVGLQFKLPDESMNDGFALMDITAKVVNIGDIDATKSKVIVMINLESPYDSYLLKYMYERQKELILELKKAIKVHKRIN